MQLKEKLHRLSMQNRTRTRMPLSKRDANLITIDGRVALNFASNDYLGLIKEPSITQALIEGARRYGVGSASSSLICGYFDSQKQVEEAFAEWLGVDRTLYFNSGYLANLGVLTTLADRNTTLLSDKYCHASLLDGITLSRARHHRYAHHDMQALEHLAQQKKPDVIVTESIFSMEGHITDLSKLRNIAKQSGATLILDDAHGLGILGQHGRGILEHDPHLQQQNTCVIAPLGKAFNAIGAIVAGQKDRIEAILQTASTYRYTTALPPALACALNAALIRVKKDHWRREVLYERIDYFKKEALLRDLPLTSSDRSPIQSILVGDNPRVLKLQKSLLHAGFFVACIRPPTVPQGKARLRISLNCLHTPKDILLLLNTLHQELTS
ncbi:MAG: aminotransferase class I/II-fold pyridoxal phosphate-dependent enzyme [Legionellaceae bacterium]